MMQNHIVRRRVITAYLLFLSPALIATSDPPSEVVTTKDQLPPIVRLAGLHDEPEYRRTIAGRVAELVHLAETTEDPVAQADLQLAAANLILAQGLEPICTRMMLGAQPDRFGPGGDESLREMLDRADMLIADAERLLGDPVREAAPASATLKSVRGRLDILQPFAEGLRAYLLPVDAAGGAHGARRAASRLSVLLEHDDLQVAAAAALWQAALRGTEPDPAPALAILEPALAEPSQQAMPYPFFARLLRCRILAAQGKFAAAAALLIQLEERCTRWPVKEADRPDYLRAVMLVQTHVLADWRDRLDAATQADERQWCTDRLAAILAKHFPDASATVARLNPAVPILARGPQP